MPSTHKWPPPDPRTRAPERASKYANSDPRSHPSYHAGRGFVPLDSTGARKKYVKAPV